MRSISILSPQLESLALLPQDRVNEYLRTHHFTYHRTMIANTIIAFDLSFLPILNKIDNRQIPLIRVCKNREDLALKMKSYLREGKEAVFVPTLNTFRQFFNLAGFIAEMKTMELLIPNSRLLVPAGLYGMKYLFGLTGQNIVSNE